MKAIRGGKHSGKNSGPSPEDTGGLVKKINESVDLEYAQLLLQLIQPFMSDVPDIDELEEKLNTGLIAWNLAVIKHHDAAFYKEYSKGLLTEIQLSAKQKQLLDKLIKNKEANYNNHHVILGDCEITTNKKGEAVVQVNSKTYEQFVQDLLAQNLDVLEEDELHEEDDEVIGPLNRTAITVLPKQPFHEWLKKEFLPGDLPPDLLEENTMYLVDTMEDLKEVEKWLKKNFDQLFSNELNEWTGDEKEWPKNRTYKMFTEWFEVKICSMIYDLGTSPLSGD